MTRIIFITLHTNHYYNCSCKYHSPIHADTEVTIPELHCQIKDYKTQSNINNFIVNVNN